RFRGLFAETRLILGYGVTGWRMIPWRQKLVFGAAAGLMAAISICNIAFPILLGRLVDLAKPGGTAESNPDDLLRAAAVILGSIAALYILREFVNVLRRYLIEGACTRLEQLMAVRVIGHLMKADLAAFSQDMIGTLQG